MNERERREGEEEEKEGRKERERDGREGRKRKRGFKSQLFPLLIVWSWKQPLWATFSKQQNEYDNKNSDHRGLQDFHISV